MGRNQKKKDLIKESNVRDKNGSVRGQETSVRDGQNSDVNEDKEDTHLQRKHVRDGDIPIVDENISGKDSEDGEMCKALDSLSVNQLKVMIKQIVLSQQQLTHNSEKLMTINEELITIWSK